MQALRWLGRLLVLLLVLLVAAAAVLWWWAGREGSARWALEQAARRVPGLQAGGVTGSLRHGLRAQQLAWRQDGLELQAQQVELAWQALPLLQGRLALDYLRAARVRIEDRRPGTGERPQPPASLALPLRLSVDDVAVGRLEWAGPPEVVLGDLAARYAYDGARHRLDLRNLRALDGHYRGEARLAAQDPFALTVHLQGRIEAPVPGAAAALPLVFQARADGKLADFDLQAKVQDEPGGGDAQATLVARVTPWAPLPLARARVDFQAFDAGALWRQAPHTLLSGRVTLEPRDPSTWAVRAELHNALAGPWDRERVPASRVQLEGDWRLPARAFVRQLDADVGGGKLQARGEWGSEQAWRIEGTLAGVNPAAVHSAMAPLPLAGRASVRGEGDAVLFDTELTAAGALRPPRSGRGNDIAAAVGALELRSLQARGRWAGRQLFLPLLVVATADARLDAALDLQPGARFGRGRADLQAPGLRLRAVGSLGRTRGGGNAKATLDDVAKAQQWLQKLPGVPPALSSSPLAGRAEAQFGWQGGWDDPEVEGTLSVPQLQPVATADEAVPWVLRDATLRFDGRLAEARVELRAQALQGERRFGLELAGRGGRGRRGAWQGEVASLQAQARDPALGAGFWRLALQRPVPLSWSRGRLEAGASQATLVPPTAAGRAAAQAVVAWDPVTWAAGELHTAGRVTGLPMAWMELLGGPQRAGSGLAGDLVFEGQWDALLGERLRLRASLVRSSGDVSVLAENAEGGAARVQAGVRQARLALEGEGEVLTAALAWESERAGTAQARLVSRLSREGGGGWSWPADAPLTGAIQAQLPRLGVWSLLAPPGWRLRGSVQADIAVSGTRGDPQLAGALTADDLALRSVVDGVALRDGRLRARLQGRELLIEEFVLFGAGPDGGRIAGTGEAGWRGEGLQARLAVQIERLRASTRNDRELTLSGQLVAGLAPAAIEVRGALHVDHARITLPDETAPRLGSDVVVHNLPPGVALGREPAKKEGARRGRPLTLALTLDLGDDFRVQGRGIQTRLAGALAVSGESLTEPRLVGVIRTVGGEYRAYGQRLEIERGVLRFTGPIDNPALDVLAIRPRLVQRVGVQITGTAQAPFVRLYAEPELPESEKLAWLVLGRPSASGGAETALLQSAAVALLQNRAGGSGGKSPAALLGLDELGLRRDGAEGPAVTLGKRLGRDLYASYERSLAGTLGSLYIFYDLSQRLTVRLQAGDRVAVDLIMTFAYD